MFRKLLYVRRDGLVFVLAIQEEVNRLARKEARPEISLINDQERSRIIELIEANTWPQGWTGEEPTGGELLPEFFADGSVQNNLFALAGE